MSSASSLVGNIGANGLNQFAKFAIQLALIPILARYWGLETYGIWLILFTLPSYFAAGDLGLVVAAGNDMTAAVAQGRREAAVVTFQTMQAGQAVLGVLLFGLAAWLATGPLNGLLEFAQAPSGGNGVATLMLLVAYGLLGMQMSAAHAALRATGAFARSVNTITAVLVAEAIVLVGAVVEGATIVDAATIYCVGHVLGVLVLRWALHRHASWLQTFPFRPSWAELRRLAPAALAMLCLPLANALSLQGPTLVLGAIAGAAAVPAFNAVRVATRAAVQVTQIVANASMPTFAVATARNDEARRQELVALALMTGLGVLVPAAIGLLLFGTELIGLWTGGIIEVSFALVATLTLAMLLSGVWMPLSVLIMAINEHGRYSYVYLGLSVATIAMTAILVKPFGALGAGLAIAVLDGLMLAWILLQARRLGLVDASSLITAPRTVLAISKRYLGARAERRKRGDV